MKTPRKFPVVITEGFATVKIYRLVQKGGVTTFSVDWRQDGQRNREAFKDYSEAKIKADFVVQRLAALDAAALQLTGKDRERYLRAAEFLKPSGIAIDTAADRYAEAVKVLGSDLVLEAARDYAKRHPRNMPQKTVREVVDELIEAKGRANRSDRHVQDLKSRCGAFADAFVNVQIQSIGTADVRRYLEGKKTEGKDIAARTFKNHVNSLTNLFEFAKARAYVPKDFDGLDGIELPEDCGGAIEIYTPKDIAAILSVASAEILPAIALGAFAGIRSQELERLTWEDIRLADKFMEIKGRRAGKRVSKTGSRRLVPVPDNLAQWLAPYANRQGPIWAGEHFDFYNSMADTVAAAKVTKKDNGLRHSFCSYRTAQAQDVAKVALEAGNSTQMIFQHYRELVTPAQAAQWFAVVPDRPANVIAGPQPAPPESATQTAQLAGAGPPK